MAERAGAVKSTVHVTHCVAQTGSIEFGMGDAVPAETPDASVWSSIAAHLSAGGDYRRGRVALVKPGLPATAFGGKGLTRVSAPAPVPPCVRRRGGAGSGISTHSLFKRGLKQVVA
jgi:hypothetical protein